MIRLLVAVLAATVAVVWGVRAVDAGRLLQERDAAAVASRSSSSYRVDWRARYRREHRHVQRLLRQLRSVRTVQAHVEARPAHYEAWLCIHRYEGAWDADTGNGYFGGLQMDLEFQRDYGASLLASEGTADHWSPLEQMQVAERAWADRGFTPWPNTARMCGLL